MLTVTDTSLEQFLLVFNVIFFSGFDCSFRIDEGWWAEEPAKVKIQGRALHEAVVIGDEMWVIGGENFHHFIFQNMIR